MKGLEAGITGWFLNGLLKRDEKQKNSGNWSEQATRITESLSSSKGEATSVQELFSFQFKRERIHVFLREDADRASRWHMFVFSEQGEEVLSILGNADLETKSFSVSHVFQPRDVRFGQEVTFTPLTDEKLAEYAREALYHLIEQKHVSSISLGWEPDPLTEKTVNQISQSHKDTEVVPTPVRVRMKAKV